MTQNGSAELTGRTVRIWLILAALYAAAGKLGLALAFVNLSATAVWLPAGIAIAALLIAGPRAWPGIFLGAFFVNQTTAGSVATSLIIAAGNTVEALAAWYLVSRFAGGRNALHRVPDIFRFVLLAGLVCTALSATIGVTALSVAGFAHWADFGALWLTWWLGDAAGVMVIAPVILCWAENIERSRAEEQTRRIHEDLEQRFDERARELRAAVTESKAAQDFVKRSEQRLKTIIDAEPACVKLVSPDGLLLEMNPAGLEMLGATDISQVVGHRVVDIVYPGDRDRFLETHRTASAGVPGRLQFRIVGLDGTQRWVDSHMVPFDTARGGDDLHRTVLSVTSDVTAQRHLEEELRQAQKLDALGRLVGSVAHDFNNFLTAIVGYTELSLRQIGDDERMYPDLKNDLKEVLNVVHRASALTKQLLIFSRRPTLDPTPVCVDVVLAPLGPMLAQLLGPEISVATDLKSGETRVRVDPTHLEQIVVNLAVNARDAMPGGGEVRVETRVVEIDATYAAHRSVKPPPGPYVMIAVSDKGGGMDDYVKAHLFEPFFTTKPVGEGTGLGLATVYGIVKQSGGYVWVTSKVGRGTTFTIHFPLVPESPPVETAAYITPPVADDNATILVVDDDDDVRAVARDVLREHGYRVLEARTGEEATQLATACTSSIHVVVSDVVLPGINGADLVQRLRRNRPDLKALFISGYGQLAIVHHRILEADAVLLEKPFTSDQLLTYVRAALTGVAASTRTDK
jgi:two-component system cell cycle sensor histidine kinase/response regulator CckA